MSNDQDEFVTIRPRRVALSHQTGAQGARSRISFGDGARRRRRGAAGRDRGLGLLVSAGTRRSSPRSRARNRSRLRGTGRGRAHRRRSSSARRRTKHCRSIANASARRRRSPSSSSCRSNSTKRCTSETGAPNAFDAAQQLANDGDALFTQQKFDDAMANYEKGIAALEALQDSRRRPLQRRTEATHCTRSIIAMPPLPKPPM